MGVRAELILEVTDLSSVHFSFPCSAELAQLEGLDAAPKFGLIGRLKFSLHLPPHGESLLHRCEG